MRIRRTVEGKGVGKRRCYYKEHCFLEPVRQGGKCPISGEECRYGLTEVAPPKSCPLRKGPITIKLNLCSSPRKTVQ